MQLSAAATASAFAATRQITILQSGRIEEQSSPEGIANLCGTNTA